MLDTTLGNLWGECGGERGIRTLEAFRLTHFPGVLLRPLGHLTGGTYGAHSSLEALRLQGSGLQRHAFHLLSYITAELFRIRNGSARTINIDV